MIDILNRWTRSVVYHSETADDIAVAVIEAAQNSVNLRGADLTGANLRGADLTGAYLRGANLRGADLTDAYLTGANLRGADLTGAYLRGADLTDAYLTGADLTGANLRGADLTGANLRGAKGLLGGPTPLQIGGSMHWIIVRAPGHITIGCMHKPVEWWEEHHKAAGKEQGYTPEQIEEYRQHIAYCKEWMQRNGVLGTVKTKEESK